MATGFGNWGNSVKVHSVLRDIAKKEVERLRPSSRLAEVTAIIPAEKKVLVRFVGESNVVPVPYTSTAPANVGQWVRIGGTTHDRYVEDVIGTTLTEARLETAEGRIGSLMESVIGEGWEDEDDGEPGTFTGIISQYFGGIEEDATEALGLAGQADTKAGQAQTTAENAQTTASNAQTTADNANTTAGQAQQTASDASAAVGGAVTAAEDADEKATLAQQIAQHITDNINALGEGVAAGTAGVAKVFDTIAGIFTTASEAQQKAVDAQTALQNLINQNEGAAAGGRSGQDNFDRPNSSTLGSGWVSTAYGNIRAGIDANGRVNFPFATNPSGDVGGLIYHQWAGETSVGDYFQSTIVFGTAFSGNGSPLAYLFNRWDGLFGTDNGVNTTPLNCWAVRITRTGGLTLYRVVNGVMTSVGTGDVANIKSGDAISLRCGSLAGPGNISVVVNGQVEIAYPDPGTGMIGANYRKHGFSGFAENQGFLGWQQPASVASYNWSDIPGGNIVLGKGFRFGRTTVANLTQVVNAQVPTTTFQTAVYSESCKPLAGSTLNAARGEFAIPYEGWWDFEFGFYGYTVSLSSGASTVLEPVLYNGQGALSTTIPMRMSKITNGGSTAARTQIQEVAKFRKYCLVGERVAPGWGATRLDYMTADAGGHTCYFNGVLLSP
ncbi:tail protein [Gordonia phage Flakey]|uniref:Minor tail protein n=1 Tax=Gordonia phage Flakey TaxID=2079280 RepID=A0A2K9VDH2_9CAUD|nr:tail protein [Gordonia phage Flakey]AUV60326.1 minor tail protein [Gordonia phage Flakey]